MKLVEESPPAGPTVEALDRIADALTSIADEIDELRQIHELVGDALWDIREELKAARTQSEPPPRRGWISRG